MVGPTLVDIRDHVEALASDGGRYYVVCGRTGDRPIPAAGKRFPTRSRAQAAARATAQYRAELRRHDPALLAYDLIVCQEPDVDTQAARQSATDRGQHQADHPPTEGSQSIDCLSGTSDTDTVDPEGQ